MGPQAGTAALCSSELLATLTQKPQFHCTVSSLTTMSQLQSLQALINFESLATVFTTCLLINRIILFRVFVLYRTLNSTKLKVSEFSSVGIVS